MPAPPSSAPPVRIVDALRFIGPGLILTAGIVGTGELVLTPRVAGENGFTLLWLIVIGCMIKVFVQVELGRFAVATGTTTLQALDDLPGPRCSCVTVGSMPACVPAGPGPSSSGCRPPASPPPASINFLPKSASDWVDRDPPPR